MENYTTIQVVRKSPESPIAYLNLNRPSVRNALPQPFWTEFPLALSSLDQNPDVAVIILSGNGGHFCAGIDLKSLQSLAQNVNSSDRGRSGERLRREIMLLQDSITAIEKCRKPVIAAVQGACIGAGVDLITACDIRYCTDDAFFSVKEVDLAMAADVGTLQRLPAIVGFGNAMELALTAKRFSGLEAKELGHVSRAFASKAAMDEGVGAIAKGIVEKSPPGVIGTKSVLLRSRDMTVSQDQIPQNSAFSPRPIGVGGEGNTMPPRRFLVMGHRGTGMNLLQSPDRRMKAIKENSLLAFNAAAKFDLDFVEFDVQVTKDDCVVIFHDNFIFTEDKGSLIEKRVTDLTLDEFLSYGPQRDPQNVGKPLFRKTKDGAVFEWKVEKDDCFCTLQEVFQKVDKSLGFNIEFKFDDNIIYKEDELVHVIQVVLQVVSEHASDRPIVFSTFQPDAALLVRKLQDTYPVCFLTNGGSEIYKDSRRNSLDEVIKLCLDGGLHGIVSEIKALLRNPGAVAKIHGLNLSLISYGQLNNVVEVVYVQYLMGVDGVIVGPCRRDHRGRGGIWQEGRRRREVEN